MSTETLTISAFPLINFIKPTSVGRSATNREVKLVGNFLFVDTIYLSAANNLNFNTLSTVYVNFFTPSVLFDLKYLTSTVETLSALYPPFSGAILPTWRKIDDSNIILTLPPLSNFNESDPITIITKNGSGYYNKKGITANNFFPLTPTPTPTPTPIPTPNLLINFDADIIDGLPVNGSTVNGYTITINNDSGQLSYLSAGVAEDTTGSVWHSTINTEYSLAHIAIPNINCSNSNYTVILAFRASTTHENRSLSTNDKTLNDWLLGIYNDTPGLPDHDDCFYPGFNFVMPPSSYDGDDLWNIYFGTAELVTGTYKLYVGRNNGVFKIRETSHPGLSGMSGFNGLYLFGDPNHYQSSGGDIAFIKVYDQPLNDSQVAAEYANYSSRFWLTPTPTPTPNETPTPTPTPSSTLSI
jgi:hypothetical protein